MKKGNFIIAFALEAFGIWIITDSYKLGLQALNDPGPGLFPFLLGILLCLLSIPIFINAARNLRKLGGVEEEKQAEYRTNYKKLGAVTGSLIGYFVLLETAGFLVTTFFFLFGSLLIGYPRRWFFCMSFSAVVVAAAYLIFSFLLQIPFPSGFWR